MALALLAALIGARPGRADMTIIQQSGAPPESLPQDLTIPQYPALGRIIQVGPTRALNVPSQAASVARAGDIIEIDAGNYVGDVTAWWADNLTIRGVGGRPRLLAAGMSAENKAIWVIKGRNAIVENIEFTEATGPNGNGAGIRAEGINLKVLNCYFHDNQEGILAALPRPRARSISRIRNSRVTAAMAASRTKFTSAISLSWWSAAVISIRAASGI